MDLRYHIAALRVVCLTVNDAQSAHGARAGTAICCGENDLKRPSKPPACRTSAAHNAAHGRYDRDRRDQRK